MGGRGASSGSSSSGGGGIGVLNRGFQGIAGSRNKLPGNGLNSSLGRLDGVYQPGYDNNGNPQVVKWQGQEEDKAARYLAKVHNGVDYNNYVDGYGFYEGDYQKFSLSLGMNDKPTIIPDKQFDQMVRQNNLQVVYRGEAGQGQVDRFMNADYSHTGVGSFGDGFYFSDDKGTANGYASMKGGAGGRVLKMALSPNARVITYSDLQNAMAKAGAKMQSALRRQGQSATGASYWNSGEAQFALKLGYNVISDCGYNGSDYHYALTRDAFIVSDKAKHHW